MRIFDDFRWVFWKFGFLRILKDFWGFFTFIFWEFSSISGFYAIFDGFFKNFWGFLKDFMRILR